MGDELEALMRAYSKERLQPYLTAAGGDPVAAMDLYDWNIDVSGAFGRPLCVLEVVLRNAVHEQMALLKGRPDWWDAPGIDLHSRATSDVEQAVASLRKRGKPVTPDRMIAELSFGFWVGLIGNRYDMAFWRNGVHRAFPHYRGTPGGVHRQLDSMRLLRNRISHHEPIHYRDLAADFATIVRLVGHMSIPAAERLDKHDGVRAVLARKPC